jgi:hypothetical protein
MPKKNSTQKRMRVEPRNPAVGTKKPMPKIVGAKPSTKKLMAKKSGVTVVLPDGSTVGLKDLGKVKPTPKPKPKATPKKTPKMTPQDAAMQKILKDRYGW